MAHDLRTPLQAFQSEVEILRDNIEELMGDKASVPLHSIEQLELIGVFMNMTINRSIDFTKASSGIKLNPSIESMNFSETLNWAVGCMRKSHTNVPIVISPIPKRIYKQIYTDKQVIGYDSLTHVSIVSLTAPQPRALILRTVSLTILITDAFTHTHSVTLPIHSLSY